MLCKIRSLQLYLLNRGVGEDSWESLGLQGDQTRPSSRKSVLKIHWKDWCWSWSSNTLATWWEDLTHWKRPWCWERLRAGEGVTEAEMVGWHHRLNGHAFEQTLGVGEGQGSLACCSPWGHKSWTWLSGWITTGRWHRTIFFSKDASVGLCLLRPSFLLRCS